MKNILLATKSDVARPKVVSPSRSPSPPRGPMTRARVQALRDKVNSLLGTYEFDAPLDGLLPHAIHFASSARNPKDSARSPQGRQGTGARREEEEEKEMLPSPENRLQDRSQPAPPPTPLGRESVHTTDLQENDHRSDGVVRSQPA